MTSPLDALSEPHRLAAFDHLAEQALAAWGGSTAPIRRIACRENAVYEVQLASGARAALRIHRHGYHTKASLQSEFTWMEALRGEGVVTARGIPTLSGASMVEVQTERVPVAHLCDVLEWVDGHPLGRADNPTTLGSSGMFERYRIVGRIAGQIHRHSMRWQAPVGFERPHWDREGCLGVGALWGPWDALAVLTPHERQTLYRAVERVDAALAQLGRGPEVYGMIHADFVPDNLIEHNGQVVVLDLDDAGYGWYLWELVTAVFWYLGTPHYTPSLEGYLAGYRSVLPLDEQQLQFIPHFLLMRALVYMGWMQTRHTQHTARVLTDRVRELSLALAERLLAGETDYRVIPLQLTPLAEEV